MALVSRKAKLKRAQIYDQKQREKEKAREENEDELFVFGYAAKLFKDDKKATEIDRGEHLIPWMGDKNFQIDRYDGRGHLHDLSEFENDSWNRIQKLSEEESRIEALCDEERYLALNTDLFEEKNRHEEEIKRLNEAIAASETSYSAISFNYDENKPNQSDTYDPMQPTQDEAEIKMKKIEEKETVKVETNVVLEEPFIAPSELKIPMDMEVPETIKMHAFMERTAHFISSRGAQMEIRIKANQAGNSQFDFLNFDHYLNPYYKHILKLIKSGHYRPNVDKQKTLDKSRTKEGKDVCNIRTTGNDDSGHHSEDDDEDDHDHSGYLHPSLVSNPRPKPTNISAIHQPLPQHISDTHRLPPTSSVHPAMYEMPPGYHDVTSLLAQGYDPAALVAAGYLPNMMGSLIPPPPPPPSSNSDHNSQIQPYISVAQGTSFAHPPPPPAPPPPPILNVNLAHTEISTSIIPTPAIYTLAPVTDVSGSPSAIPSGADNSNIIPPTPDIQPIIDKMAKYVARNGEEFEATVRAKNDSRFEFLLPWHSFYTYYKYKKNVFLEECRKGDENEDDKRKKAPISFSIKTKDSEEKLLDRPSALPYESSESDEENGQKEPTTKRVNTLQGKVPPPCAQVYSDPVPMIVDEREEIFDRHMDKGKLGRGDFKQSDANKVMARQKIADRLAQAARGKLQQSSKERNVQMERRKKAALFLTMIKDKQVTMVPEGILDQVSSKEANKRNLSPTPRRSSNHSRSVSPVRSRSPSNTIKTSRSREASPVRKKKRSRSRSPVKRPKSPASRSYKAVSRHTKRDKVNNRSRSPSPIPVRRTSPFRRSGSVGSSVTFKPKAESKMLPFSTQTSTMIKPIPPVMCVDVQPSKSSTPPPPASQTTSSEASSQPDKLDKTNKLREKIRAMLAMTREIGINKDS